MEMYNEGSADNAAMIHGTNESGEPPSLDQHPEVKQARKFLFIFTGTDLVFCLINFFFVIHSYAASESLKSQTPNSSTQLSLIIVSLIYYGFGLLVIYRYYQTGLLVFAILGIVLVFLTSAVIIDLLIRIMHTATHEEFMTAGTIVGIIFVISCFLASILQILIVLYAFKLYRLLKANKRLTIEQI